MNISDFDYELPEGRIARFPVAERDASKLLVWKGGEISETVFDKIGCILPASSLLVFNNTRVVRARLVMHKPAVTGAAETTGTTARGGARVEILCLEPFEPADYERAFAAKGSCEWLCMVGNLKKWKSGPVEIPFICNGTEHKLQAWRVETPSIDSKQSPPHPPTVERETSGGSSVPESRVRFEWNSDLTFGKLLEILGRIPIPPYLGRDSETIDNTRYQTVYARVEGSVAAPTAGLHFSSELISALGSSGIELEEVTLHVGAGTFLPVKTANALEHTMHTEHFEVTLTAIEHLIAKRGNVIAVGTTSVRTLESLSALGWRISKNGDPELIHPVGQFELYDIPANFDGRGTLEALVVWMRTRGLEKLSASTRIMITPAGFRFRIVNGMITNFHQPKSTLLLLVSAFVGNDQWRIIYDHALERDFRFLSYGDSSLLLH